MTKKALSDLTISNLCDLSEVVLPSDGGCKKKTSRKIHSQT